MRSFHLWWIIAEKGFELTENQIPLPADIFINLPSSLKLCGFGESFLAPFIFTPFVYLYSLVVAVLLLVMYNRFVLYKYLYYGFCGLRLSHILSNFTQLNKERIFTVELNHQYLYTLCPVPLVVSTASAVLQQWSRHIWTFR